jgi:hypothetical protein
MRETYKPTKLTIAAILTLLATMLSAGTAIADVPETVAFTGTLYGEAGPVDGMVSATFRLFDAEDNGTEVWSETHELDVVGGLMLAELGSVDSPLTAAIFDGSSVWLEVEVDGEILTPRSPVASVPYAIAAAEADYAASAGDADTLGGQSPSSFQSAISGSCSPGSSIQSIAGDGTVTCEDTASKASDSDALGGLPSASYQQRVSASCAAGSSIRSIAANGSVTCELDSDSGDITAVNASGGLSGGGTSGSVSLSVATGGITRARVASGYRDCNASTDICERGDMDTRYARGLGGAMRIQRGITAGDPNQGTNVPLCHLGESPHQIVYPTPFANSATVQLTPEGPHPMDARCAVTSNPGTSFSYCCYGDRPTWVHWTAVGP